MPDDQQSDHREMIEAARRQAQQADEETLTFDARAPTTDSNRLHGRAPGAFPGYELVREINRGGQGMVYEARQVNPNRKVAVKAIASGCLASEAEVRRFQIEAEAVANLDHPNIVPIYEVGQHEGWHYFSMKLIEGGSLAGHLLEYRDHHRAAARLVATAARAVHYAHQRGILHRDLKPANILLQPDGQPCISDFGLAKRVDSDSGVTETGAVLGTASYMAPEQAAGRSRDLTTAVDVYGLGAILYAMITGRPPFSARTSHETLQQVREQEPERLRTRERRVNRDLESICLKCLDKDPQRRYGAAASLAEDLDRWGRGEPIRARRVGAVVRSWRWARRHPLPAGLAATAATTLVLVTAAAIAIAGMGEQAVRDIVMYAAERHRDAAVEGPMANFVAETARDAILHTRLQGNDRAGMNDFLRSVLTISNDPGQGPLPPDEQVRFASWFVLDPKGILIAVYPNTGDVVGLDLHERDYFRGLVTQLSGDPADTTTRVSGVYHSHNDGLYKFAITAPLRAGDDEGAEFLGLLAASVYPARAVEAIRTLERGQQLWSAVALAPFTIFAVATIWYGIRRSINRRFESGDCT